MAPRGSTTLQVRNLSWFLRSRSGITVHTAPCVCVGDCHTQHTHRLALPSLLLTSRLLLQCSDSELKLIQTQRLIVAEAPKKPPRLRLPDTDLQHRLPLLHLV